jgi:hypothetical protein
MHCREFRRNHDAFIDDTLSGVDIDRMANHCRVCESCSQLDTRVRRALLLARNLPTIQPSPAFGERLQARLSVERALLSAAARSERAMSAGRWRPFSPVAYSAVLAGVLAAAGLAMAVNLSLPRDSVIQLPPVVASLPEPEPSPLTTPTMVAAVPAGMPLWPAVFVAQQAPWHFASDAAGR